MANTKLPLSTGRRAVELAILARGSTSLTASQLAAMRHQSLDQFPTPLRPQFLKHSDDQTLTALAALTAAIDAYEVADDFQDWAIVSSTRYLGRAAFATVIDKYQVDGPWGVSVQVIPHTAPHAVAGTLSLALGSHGPSIGAGAAAGDESQALFSAATLLQRPDISRVWILLTGWLNPRSLLQPGETEPTCGATALAVANARPDTLHPHHSLGRIVIDVCGLGEAEASGGEKPMPLTQLLVRHRSADLRWGQTCRGMRTLLELRAEEASPSQPCHSRAA